MPAPRTARARSLPARRARFAVGARLRDSRQDQPLSRSSLPCPCPCSCPRPRPLREPLLEASSTMSLGGVVAGVVAGGLPAGGVVAGGGVTAGGKLGVEAGGVVPPPFVGTLAGGVDGGSVTFGGGETDV